MTVVVLAQTNLKPIPPPGYGGIERMIDCLCRGLSDNGTEVLLVANKDARTAAKQIDMPVTIPTSRAGRVKNILRLGALLRRLNRQSTILHSFLDIPYWFPLHAFWKGRVICTFSCTPIIPKHIRAFAAVRRSNAVLCGVSDALWRGMPYPELWRTVYNGIDTSLYSLPSSGSAERRGSLLCLGRISPMKGVHIAIDVAERSGIPLVIAGNLSPERGGQEYFEEAVRPRLGRHIQWVGEVTDQQKAALFETSRALLFPTQCEDPCPLVVMEAMASGVPVIASRKGGVPEIVVDGKTGFVCDTTDQMVGAVERLSEISPSSCRNHVLEHFSARVMVQSYLRLYEHSSN